MANEWDIEELEEWDLDLPFKSNKDEVINEKQKVDNYVDVVVVVAKNLNELDKLSNLYNLECVNINEDIKTQVLKKGKMYVFKK